VIICFIPLFSKAIFLTLDQVYEKETKGIIDYAKKVSKEV
jgi:hypothetical protein